MSVIATDALLVRVNLTTTYQIDNLTEFGFRIVETVELDPEEIHEGTLVFTDSQEFTARFRIRRGHSQTSKCAFHKMEIADRERLKALVEKFADPVGDANELDNKSYDELASGDPANSENSPSSSTPAPPRRNLKALVAICLTAGMVGVLVLVATFVRMRYTVKVASAVMIGNYLPVNTQVEGEVAEVLVSEGQKVRKGMVLVRLKNQTLKIEHQLANAELNTARAEVLAYEKMAIEFQAKITIATQKLRYEIVAAKADLIKAQFDYKTADIQVRRLQPLLKSQNLAQVDYELALSHRAALKALCVNKQTVVKILEVSQDAASKDILVLGDRVDDAMTQIRAKLSIARARVKQLAEAARLAASRAAEINVVAPRDGTIYAIYRQPGEYLKIAEEALAMNLPSGGWATGHVPAEQATKIRPGQSVNVKIPSMGLTTKGLITAVGHRAVHGKGGYSAEFRGAVTDVPIKVSIDDLAAVVPSGIRLKMVVNLGYPWKKKKEVKLPIEAPDESTRVAERRR